MLGSVGAKPNDLAIRAFPRSPHNSTKAHGGHPEQHQEFAIELTRMIETDAVGDLIDVFVASSEHPNRRAHYQSATPIAKS
jgi:hypothetical protein